MHQSFHKLYSEKYTICYGLKGDKNKYNIKKTHLFSKISIRVRFFKKKPIERIVLLEFLLLHFIDMT